ncbi:MAG: FHA domain-containing protein [Lachnospiraceae bacterium]|nr:FHA domain-containing protein [Lachnospiraceae bacterium]
MEVKYRADLYANYMLIEIPEYVDIQSYSFKMMEKNRIKGVLPTKTRMEDGRGFLYVDVSNKRNLIDIYQEKEMELEEMTRIFQGLLPVLEELRNFLLTEKMICLDPKYIFEEEENQRYYVVILPWQDEAANFRKLAEFFLEKINHKDEYGVNAAYHFYRQQSQTQFSLYHFMTILEKENIMKRQKKNIPKETKPISIEEWDDNIETEENGEENIQHKEIFKQRRKYFLLLVSILCLGAQFLNHIPIRIKISCLAISILCFIMFFVCLIFDKNKGKEKNENKEVKEEKVSLKKEFEVGETVFFESMEKDEEWKLQWKEHGRKKQIVLKDFPCKVGKMKEEVQIVINDISVSRIHCQFIKKENKIAIVDLNSTNGTYLNGLPLENGEIQEIEKNDEILVGKVKVLVV